MGGADPAFGQLLGEIAAPTPAPGAGSTAAWTTAMAASLVEMAAGLTLSRADLAERHAGAAGARERAAALRSEALDLAERERTSFAPVLEALRLPREDPARAERVAGALSDAAQAPIELAAVACEVAQLAAELATTGNPALEGDAAAGALLAEAACRAAGRLVELNLARAPEDPRLARAGELAAAAAAARDVALRREGGPRPRFGAT